MTGIQRARLNREDFVNWLAKSMSGHPVQPRVGSVGTEKPSDVTIAWARTNPSAWPVVGVAQAQLRDFFAFVSTYTKLRPYSAFFRVIPLELMSTLKERDVNQVRDIALAKCVAGAALAEVWVASARESDRPKNVYPLLLSSLSAALGQVALADYDQAAFEWVLQEWIEIQRQPKDLLRLRDLEARGAPWQVLLSASSTSGGALEDDRARIANFVSKAFIRGTIEADMLRGLRALAGPIDLAGMLAAPREQRIGQFNDLLADLKRRGERGLTAEFLAGLMLAIAGNGAFEMLRSAREFDGWLDGAVTWFGFCAALFEESNVLTYGDSAGRRLVRDITRAEDPFLQPRADINSSELRFLSTGGGQLQYATHSVGSVDVEILPNVMSRVVDVATEDDGHRREETEWLVRSLEEASYLIDRARQLADDTYGIERRNALAKPSRRGRIR